METTSELVIAEVFQNCVYVILTKCGGFATWSLPWGTHVLRKWGRNAPAPPSPTPFGLLLNHIKLRKYNTYVAFKNGAGAGPTPFPAGNGVGPEPTAFC